MTEPRQQGSLSLDGIPEIPDRVGERTRRYQNTRYATLYGWLGAGEELLIGTRFGETNQLHLVSQPGGARRQLTFFDGPVWLGRANPNPSHRDLLFIKDEGGSEAYQVYYLDLDEGQPVLMTDGVSRNSDIVWSNRGDRFAHYSTVRNGRDLDVWVADPHGGAAPRCVLEAEGYWFPVAWSPDGQGLFVASDQGTEYRTLRYLDLSTGEQRHLTGDIPWDVTDLEVSPCGDLIAAVVDEDGASRLYLVGPDGTDRRRIEGLPMGVMGRVLFHPGGRLLAFGIETPRAPRDIYVVDLDTGEMARWTDSEVGGASRAAMVEPELVHYPTFDEVDGAARQISCYWYRPSATPEPTPVVVQIHGGPESQFLPSFDWFHQFLVNELGVSVLAPNVRGFTAYGKAFAALDNGLRHHQAHAHVPGAQQSSRAGQRGRTDGGHHARARC